ncbi:MULTISPECIES: HEAT repeat domain-containing protein [unclassified Microcoleus]|uniref:HEAT repeat domain-containing protein n=1 Tax=unclassified Microcoleus TaxID=2642155 RepID=UPI002FD2024D
MADTAHQIQGFWPMTTHYRKKIVAVIALSFLSFTSPLLLIRSAVAESVSAAKASSKEISSLIEKLKSNDEKELDAAIEKLVKIGEPAIPALIEALREKNLLVRRSVAQVLGRNGNRAIPALVNASKDSDVKLRRNAVNVLGEIMNGYRYVREDLSEAKNAVPQLIPLLKDSDADVRSSAARALGTMGAEAKNAVPQLILLLKDSDADVRSSAASALGNIPAKHKTVVPQLIPLLKDSDAGVRSSAARALENMGAEAAKTAMPQLILLIKDSDINVRRSATSALQNIGAEAKTAVPQLILLLKDSDINVRSNAADVLGSIGAEAKTAVPQLIPLLKDSDAVVRLSATSALRRIGAEAKTAMPQLIPLLKDSDIFMRSNAADVLGNIGAEAKTAVPQLILLLKDSDADVRSNAARVLGRIGAEAKTAVPQLILLLKDSDINVGRSATKALGSMGAEAKTAVPQLILLLKDSDKLRTSAAYALEDIALSLQEKANTLTPSQLNQAVSNLESALKILEPYEAERDDQYISVDDESVKKRTIANLRVYIKNLKAEQNAKLFNLMSQNQWVAATIIYLIFFPSLWFAILRLRPLWLLRINDALKPYEFKLPETWGGAPVRIRDLTFISIFIYRPRVLDSWVSAHIETVREQFAQRNTVKSRATYIPVSFELDDKKLPQLRGQDLPTIFTKKRICLLIWGEGGIGKTSIACQIADWAMERDKTQRLCKHLMIPILIEEELDSKVAAGKHPFFEAIRGQLKSITNHPTPIAEELLQKLLQQRRILVIADHFSEMAETTQKEIDPNAADFPINALVVTSRLDSTMGKANKNTLHPLRIEGSELSAFMEKYLDKLGKLNLFNGSQFHYACGDLAKLLEEIRIQGRSTTVLFAKLYADVLVAKMEGNKTGKLPENIPDLMLSYLNELNRDMVENKLTDITVHEDAKLLAWECLKLTYRPTSTKIEDAINALSAFNSQDVERRFNYLQEKLHLIQTNVPSKENIRFVLDPVAEYLAGLHLVDIYGEDESKWRDFIIDADFQNSPEAIKGFMLAVRDCYLAKIPGARDTNFLPKEIAARYNVLITVPLQSPQAVSPG